MTVRFRIILLFVGLLGAYTGAFAQRPAESGVTNILGAPPVENDPPRQTCQTNPNWESVRYSVDLPATTKDYTVTEVVDGQTITHHVACPWGKSNYLGLGVDMLTHTPGDDGKDGLAAARRDRLVFPASSSLASGKRICSVEIAATSGTFLYDDYVFLTLNNRIVAAGQYYESELSNLLRFRKDPITNLYEFDLARLINSNHYVYSTVDADKTNDADKTKPMRNDISNAYCAPGAYCVTPKSDLNPQSPSSEGASGNARFAFSYVIPEAFQSINPQTLDLWITGNQGKKSDCSHSGLSLDVVVRYLPDE